MSHLSLAALVVANVLVAVQALRWEWGYYQVFLIYWLEALIIGGYNVLRMLVVGLFGDRPFGVWLSQRVGFSAGSRISMTLLGAGFFALKFGGFALATGFWLLMLPAFLDDAGTSPAQRVLEGLDGVGEGTGFAAGGLAASHGISFLWNFLAKREFATQSVLGLLFWPYLRVALVLVVVIGGLFVVKLNPGMAGATTLIVLLVLAKTIADAATHLWEHRTSAFRSTVSQADQAQNA